LFGPTDPAVWGPRGERVCVLAAEERSAEGLRRLAVERVWEALAAWL